MESKEHREGASSPGSKFKNLKKLNLGKKEEVLNSHSINILKKNLLEPREKLRVG